MNIERNYILVTFIEGSGCQIFIHCSHEKICIGISNMDRHSRVYANFIDLSKPEGESHMIMARIL